MHLGRWRRGLYTQNTKSSPLMHRKSGSDQSFFLVIFPIFMRLTSFLSMSVFISLIFYFIFMTFFFLFFKKKRSLLHYLFTINFNFFSVDFILHIYRNMLYIFLFPVFRIFLIFSVSLFSPFINSFIFVLSVIVWFSIFLFLLSFSSYLFLILFSLSLFFMFYVSFSFFLTF